MSENNDILENEKIDKPVMIPIDIMMISGDCETAPADRMTYAQIAWVTSEQLHGRIKMRLDDLQAEINKCVEENNHV